MYEKLKTDLGFKENAEEEVVRGVLDPRSRTDIGYCHKFCKNGTKQTQMIACEEKNCEVEWVSSTFSFFICSLKLIVLLVSSWLRRIDRSATGTMVL